MSGQDEADLPPPKHDEHDKGSDAIRRKGKGARTCATGFLSQDKNHTFFTCNFHSLPSGFGDDLIRAGLEKQVQEKKTRNRNDL